MTTLFGRQEVHRFTDGTPKTINILSSVLCQVKICAMIRCRRARECNSVEQEAALRFCINFNQVPIPIFCTSCTDLEYLEVSTDGRPKVNSLGRARVWGRFHKGT